MEDESFKYIAVQGSILPPEILWVALSTRMSRVLEPSFENHSELRSYADFHPSIMYIFKEYTIHWGIACGSYIDGTFFHSFYIFLIVKAGTPLPPPLSYVLHSVHSYNIGMTPGRKNYAEIEVF